MDSISLNNIYEYISLQDKSLDELQTYPNMFLDFIIFLSDEITVICWDCKSNKDMQIESFEGFVNGVDLNGGELTQEKIDYLDSIIDNKKIIRFMIDMRQSFNSSQNKIKEKANSNAIMEKYGITNEIIKKFTIKTYYLCI